jgi:hypothetical protein
MPDEYAARIATLVYCAPADAEGYSWTDMMTRWGLQNLTTDKPLTVGEGPTFVDIPPMGARTEHRRYTMPGTVGESSALWLSDDLDECERKVRSLRGILHIGKNLTYDLTRWSHLTDPRGRGGTCHRCGAEVKVYARTGRRATVDGENYDCPGEVWFPAAAAAQAPESEYRRYGRL